ncbi:hypothetical protein [Halovenus sp. HT40]|uniref:hypothetical protein n=1 Tax=Halovenus sp. HT40 TaxID=3126691 RepID=UPI00300F08F2
MTTTDALQRLLSSDSPVEWIRYRGLKKLAEAIYSPIEQNEGVDLLSEDWDNCIILDACRFDTFRDLEPELSCSGTLSKVKSKGTRTVKFLERNFPDEYNDIVYVTVNPFVTTVLDDPFYKTEYVDATEKDKKAGAILPETVLNSALQANSDYPNKRLIIHFLQPHHPFVGATQIEREFEKSDSGIRKKARNPWRLFAKGELRETKLRNAYRDNLRKVFPAVEKLSEELVGKTIVTSDHGESFGDPSKSLPWRIYGHGGPRISALVDVPWYELEYDTRKNIKLDHSPAEQSGTSSSVQERLKKLGYIE